MIPFCVPRDHLILNLQHVVSIVEHPALASAGEVNGKRGKWIEVRFSDGREMTFDGKDAEIILSQVMLCFQHFQAMLGGIAQQLQQAASGIVVPTMKPPIPH